MPVSFLDLVPAPATATVKVNTRTGPVELELTGVSLRALADIAKRFPGFARALEGAGNIMDNPEALAALVAAALGHPGEPDYERKVEQFPAAETMQMALAIVRLTFPQADVVPLPVPADPVEGDGLDLTSPLRLSN